MIRSGAMPRSAPSPAVSVWLPPATPPELTDLRVNEAGLTPMASIVTWASPPPSKNAQSFSPNG